MAGAGGGGKGWDQGGGGGGARLAEPPPSTRARAGRLSLPFLPIFPSAFSHQPSLASHSTQCCTSLTVLHDDGASRATVVEQATRFLFKTLRVRLRLDTDRPARTLAYVALEGGLLRVFEGRWWVEAVPGGVPASRVLCDQWVRPSVAPPSPLRGAFRGALAKKAASSLGELAQRAVWAAAGEGDVTEEKVAAFCSPPLPPPVRLVRAGSSASFATAASSMAPTPGDASPLAVAPLASGSDGSEASDASRAARRRSRGSARRLLGAGGWTRSTPAAAAAAAAELEARVAALALDAAAAGGASGGDADAGGGRATTKTRRAKPVSLTRRWRRGRVGALAPEVAVRV